MADPKPTAPPGLTRDPHVAIMQAAKRGRGLRLTAAECRYLAQDDAIETRAEAVRHGDAVYPENPA